MPEFLLRLFSWYLSNARDLPFRHTRDPYLIWLSEIIMQQTRIEQGVPYYNRFAESFPDVFSLASADEDSVLKLWQGLGYYSRARNLHTAAKEVVEKYGGNFPQSYDGLRSLKGVGDYTAAAIASVCFDLPHPVIDGNVIRFITRHFGITSPIETSATRNSIMAILRNLILSTNGFVMTHDASGTGDVHQGCDPLIEARHFAQAASGSAKRDRSGGVKMRADMGRSRSVAEGVITNPVNPGLFNQSMIEFGAMFCVPRNPDCSKCIFIDSCIAFAKKMVDKIPVKKQAAALKTRYFNYLVISHPQAKGFYLNKRTADDIWKGLYEFPLIETPELTNAEALMKTSEWKKIFGRSRMTIESETSAKTHLLSHQKILVKYFRIITNKEPSAAGTLMSPEEISQLPVPKIIERWLAN